MEKNILAAIFGTLLFICGVFFGKVITDNYKKAENSEVLEQKTTTRIKAPFVKVNIEDE